MKFLRYLLLTLILLPLILGATLIGFVTTIDPSHFIPEIEKQLAKQNIDADIQGQFSWQFYPKLGLSIENISLKQLDDRHNTPLAKIGNASFYVMLMPLLKREIQIKGITLNHTSLMLHTDKEGNTNWAKIGQQESAATTAPNPAETNATLPKIDIESVTIGIDQLHVKNEQTLENIKVSNIAFNGTNINIAEKPFQISGGAALSLNSLPKTAIKFLGELSLNISEKTANIRQIDFNIEPEGYSANPITLSLQQTIHWGEPLQMEGKLSTSEINPKRLMAALQIEAPETNSQEALTKASLNSTFKMENNLVTLPSTQVKIDSTTLTGNTEIVLSENENTYPSLNSHWTIDKLTLDNYLAPEKDTPETSDQPTQATELPFELLNKLSLDFSLAIQSLEYSQSDFKNTNIAIKNKNGLGKLNLSINNAFEGSLNAEAQLIAKEKPATLNYSGNVNNLNVGLITNTFADMDNISGNVSSSFSGNTQGTTDKELTENIYGKMQLNSEKLVVTPINIEQQFCKALTLLGNKSSNDDNWEASTPLSPISLKAEYSKGNINLETFSTNIQKLLGVVSGKMNLISGDFDFPIGISMRELDHLSSGCGKIDKKWLNKALPIRCKGNLSSLGINTCTPDSAAIKNLAKQEIQKRYKKEEDKIEQKAKEKRAKAKQEVSDEIEKKAGSLLDKETSDKLEDAWKKFRNKN